MDRQTAYSWDRELLEALSAVGVRPGPETRPAVVKNFVAALYRYELRRLRRRLLDGEFPRSEYAHLVAALRPRYWMLSIPAARWAEREG